jgi:hypothetical protein
MNQEIFEELKVNCSKVIEIKFRNNATSIHNVFDFGLIDESELEKEPSGLI